MTISILAKLDKKKTILSFGVCLLLSFTFCVFGPMELYFTNASELWFSITDLLMAIIPVFLILFCFVIVILLLIKGKWYNNIITLLFGLGIALYAQGNLFNITYGVLNGKEINWGYYTKWAVINTLIWIVLIFLPFVILHSGLFKKEVCNKFMAAIAFFIVAIQISTLTVLIITNIGLNKTQFYLSDKGKFELSRNKNVVVFVLDSFDGGLFNEVIDKYPIYKEKFSDFTYFNNVLGAYDRTNGALPFILTGQYNENKVEYSEYISNSFEKTDFYRDLANYGFDTRIYTSTSFIDGNQNRIINNIAEQQPKVNSYIKLTNLMYRFTALRYMPHIFKKDFWMYSGDFDQLKSSDNKSEKQYNVLGSDGQYSLDYNFYHELLDKGIGNNNKQNAFRFYHLNGAHGPFVINENIEYVSKDTASAEQQALGALNIVSSYIDQAKKQDVYDNTTFIITGDHGYKDMCQHPMFLIKKPEQHKTFEVSNAPASLEDFQATIMQQITKDYSKYGKSVFDINENENRIRRFLSMPLVNDRESKKGYLLPLTEYLFYGAADDISSAKKTGKIYTDSGVVSAIKPVYKYGKVLNFGGNQEAQQYFEYGINEGVGDSAWTLGSKSKIIIPLSNLPPNELKIHFDVIDTFDKRQQVKVFVNGHYIEEKQVIGSIDIIVPNKFVTENHLEIDLEYPNAQSANRTNLDSQDVRTLSLLLKSMVIEEFQFPEFADKTMSIDFDKNGNSDSYIESGFWEQEDQNRWAGKEASVIFKMTDPQDIKLSMEYFTFPESGVTEVYYNGNKIDTLAADSVNATLVLPAKYFNKNGIQKIAFRTPNAVSPKSINKNEDTRVLSIGVKSIVLEKLIDTAAIPDFSEKTLTIGFGKSENNSSFIESGWWEQEDTHRWAGKEASLAFSIDKPADIKMAIEYFSLPESGETEVYYNGTKVDTLSVKDGQKTVELPSKYCNKDGIQRITFKTPGSVSPKSINKNEDTRVLSIGVTKIELAK